MTTDNKSTKRLQRIEKAKGKLLQMASAKASDKKILKQVETIRELEKKAKKEAKKAEKALKSAEKKKTLKAKKSANPVQESSTPNPEEPSEEGSRSIQLSYRQAIAALQSMDTLDALSAFLKGEKRASVLKRAASRRRSLQ
jgi:hypothetical protein